MAFLSVQSRREQFMTANEIIQRWIQDANDGRVKIGKRELSNDENALIIQVLQCIGADIAAQAEQARPAHVCDDSYGYRIDGVPTCGECGKTLARPAGPGREKP
jgi:hypothetical protein